MSRLLAETLPTAVLSDRCRHRIRWLLSVLRSQRFFPAVSAEGDEPYGFIFKDCVDAVAAYRERLPKAIELAKAVVMAELEVNGEYNEAWHDSFFADLDANGLGGVDADLFPDYLICLRPREMRAQDYDTLLEAFSAGLCAKVLLETDDILEPSPMAGGNPVFASRSSQIARTMMDLNTVYVLQAGSANLFQLRDAIARGMAYPGPSLFSVFTGQTDGADFPPYLIAAAATESRAFPTLIYDPSAGSDWASRFSLADNPQAELDWPIQTLSYEDEDHQRQSESLAFTFVDFVACDQRYHKHFAGLPRASWTSSMVPVSEFFTADADRLADKVPYIMMVDRNNRLQRVIVDERLVREAHRCFQTWRSLQELGGIHNSHVARLLAQERELWEKQRSESAAAMNIPTSVQIAADVAATSVAPPATGKEGEPTKPSDGPYIETPRCTSCNECTQINNKMFAYDANKQAFIADPDAGTYRQLVEAAESCQVAIIHPGKPRNPSEPGLDELIKRAEPFL
jgi:ferredoxin